jgi:hypothetical protein
MTSTITSLLHWVPFWLPPVIAVIVLCGYYIIAGPTGFPGRTFIHLAFLAIFIGMAALTPLPVFTRKLKEFPGWFPLAVAYFFALVLLGLFILGGSVESYAGGPYPGFHYRFPVLGWMMDTVIAVLGAGDVAYFSPGYEVILWAGLYLEIMIVSFVLYWVLSHDYRTRKPS